MISSGLIIAISALLLAYWFRYTCLLILCTKAERNHASAVAARHKLAFQGVREKLATQTGSLDPLARAIERDYAILNRLMAKADGLVEPWPMEDWMLRLNFAAQRILFWASRRISVRMAHAALGEMVGVVEHLAESCGMRMNAQRGSA
ncbi:MAG: hypothetical protein R2762_01380 [Bryobacteraceae bacterium]